MILDKHLLNGVLNNMNFLFVKSMIFIIFIHCLAYSFTKFQKPGYSIKIPNGWEKIKDIENHASFEKERASIGVTVDVLRKNQSFKDFILMAIDGNKPHGFVLARGPKKETIGKHFAYYFRMHAVIKNQVMSVIQHSFLKSTKVYSVIFTCFEPNCEKLKKEYLSSLTTLKL